MEELDDCCLRSCRAINTSTSSEAVAAAFSPECFWGVCVVVDAGVTAGTGGGGRGGNGSGCSGGE